MSDKIEQLTENAYINGEQSLARKILTEILPYINKDEKDLIVMAKERSQAIAQLRDLCGDFGDLDWNENLHLADILSKHLEPHLYDMREMVETICKGSLQILTQLESQVMLSPETIKLKLLIEETLGEIE